MNEVGEYEIHGAIMELKDTARPDTAIQTQRRMASLLATVGSPAADDLYTAHHWYNL